MPISLANWQESFLPPGSYINAQAFDLKKLGALIDYLIRNPDMYEFFFDWKNYYYYTVRPRHWWDPDYKDVCQRMKLFKLFNADV
ncbi:unnamed protein product [Chrysodeixis includens]|uniref:Fucosyltransferase n=1 Tax=Chrysodeixis includens TaxID=689277 RepID=A0A9N8Q1I1_CHRIL|nr:unnamed protein product [Chrysodeixis includens]